ncbi:hypothetical protein RhiirA4_427057 [Rhizophagus irregularis]|uniref:Uncharacterized protein n=1 Tax=Rhizophagus irregularis TaxID=588596 RepID=A0A2I1H7J9_9GLOM|nr:hypothetical protein RhiirA4_425131 [Rhizophagus irregularis]PKY54840.1 hypothetical protein RhiirA4_427057 [Rhizophagus irregularis]
MSRIRSHLEEKKTKERAKTWESVEIRNQQLNLNLLKVNEQINQVLAYQALADEGELIIRGKNRQVDDDIIDDNNDNDNNDKSTDVSANQASSSIIPIAMGEVNRTILPSTGRDVVNVFRMWALPNNMEFILDPNDQRMAKIFTSAELDELRNMAKCHINLAINKDLWDFVELFCIAFVRRVDVLNASEDWWSANIINILIEFCYFDLGERDSEVRIKSGNKPDFHLIKSPQLMRGEIKREDDLKTDQQNTALQELSDELEFVFEKRVGIYVIHILGNGVYFGTEIDNFEIPTILRDIDKLIDGIQKVLISKVRFEESVKSIEIAKKVVYPSSPEICQYPIYPEK